MSWEPLCSHLPLNEQVQCLELKLTPEQLEEMEKSRRARNQASSVASLRRWRIDQRANNPDEYYAMARARNNDYNERNRERVNHNAFQAKAKILEEKRFPCEPCNYVGRCPAELERHCRGQPHKDTVAGITRAPVLAKSAEATAKRAEAKASGRFKCTPCDKPFGRAADYRKHCTTDKHRNRVAAITTSKGSSTNVTT